MYRYLFPETPRELSLGMLLEPMGNGCFRRAAEADGWTGLIGAVLGDPTYENDSPPDRLLQRLRLAHDAALLLELDGKQVEVSDHDGNDLINVASDKALLCSLDDLGIVSLEPGARDPAR
jgi:hypothetical protein